MSARSSAQRAVRWPPQIEGPPTSSFSASAVAGCGGVERVHFVRPPDVRPAEPWRLAPELQFSSVDGAPDRALEACAQARGWARVKSKLAKLVLDIRTGFWLRPLLMLCAGVGIGVLGTQVDQWLLDAGRVPQLGGHASPSGARSLLSVAAGGLATTLAIALSMTMVTVQLASSQYTPRLMRRFLSDRFTQAVLGAYLGAIAFQFLILRAVRSPDEGEPFVPVVSLAAAVLATLACLGLLVVFLHRTMRLMQASTLIASIGRETIEAIRAIDVDALVPAPDLPDAPACIVRATTPGYVQLINDGVVRKALPQHVIAARRDTAPGDFVLIGTPLVSLYGSPKPSQEMIAAIRDGFAIGSERTTEADLLFGIRQLVDVALKALSPGINDVTTAVMVVNELGAVLQAVADTDLVRNTWFIAHDDPAPPYLTRTINLESCLELALGEIEAASHDHPRVLVRMLELLALIADQARSAAVRGALEDRQRWIRTQLARLHPAHSVGPSA